MTRRRVRRVIGWGAWIVALLAFAGWVVALAGAGVAVWHLWRAPPPAFVIRLAAFIIAAVPVVWLLGNASRLGEVTSDLATENLAAHWLAAVGLSMLALGVGREVLRREPYGRDGETEEQ